MSTVNLSSVMAGPADQDTIVRAVTVIMGTVVGLTFYDQLGDC